MAGEARTGFLLAELGAGQTRLRELLSGRDEAGMAARRADGGWSVVETVRHLLFAEQLHLGRFVAGAQAWSPLGFTPESMRAVRKLPPVEIEPIPSLNAVLSAWASVHATTMVALAEQDGEEVVQALTRNLRHLRSHIGEIERLVRRGQLK